MSNFKALNDKQKSKILSMLPRPKTDREGNILKTTKSLLRRTDKLSKTLSIQYILMKGSVRDSNRFTFKLVTDIELEKDYLASVLFPASSTNSPVPDFVANNDLAAELAQIKAENEKLKAEMEAAKASAAEEPKPKATRPKKDKAVSDAVKDLKKNAIGAVDEIINKNSKNTSIQIELPTENE